MAITLIEQKPSFYKEITDLENSLAISEMFCDTLQGEGVSTGIPSTFIRLQGCTLRCTWCDTLDVWSQGNRYSFDEIFEKFESVGLIEKFKKGQHLVLTGGSPLKQQEKLNNFLQQFFYKYNFFPFTEIENEGVLMPIEGIINKIDQWNNSPKLSNSGMKKIARIKPEILKFLKISHNSWFKFVISNENDWLEIEEDFLKPGFIDIRQIILMPEGQTQEELNKKREIVAQMAIDKGVRFSDRLHITIYDRKTGV